MEIIEKPVKKVYTMKSYMENLLDRDIKDDQDVQRAAGLYSPEMNNELVYTILTDDYIPPIILGQDTGFQIWIIDGLQRSTCFRKFRMENYKITSKIKNSVVLYRKKIEKEDGTVAWEIGECDIKNKTYDMLPKELQKKFDEYQVETVIHEKCSTSRLSALVRRYNNHKAMNTDQKAFTSIANHARKIKRITGNHFFVECGNYGEKDWLNGKIERVVMESVMCINYLDEWKSSPDKTANYLNENAHENVFDHFEKLLSRLELIVGSDFKDIFNTKNSFIWFSVFDRFTKYRLDDKKFYDFLHSFKGKLGDITVDAFIKEKTESGGTKDTKVVNKKIEYLERLMEDFLNMTEKKEKENVVESDDDDMLDFLKENVASDITKEDVAFYLDIYSDLSLNVDNRSKLLETGNNNSLVAIIAYGCHEDIDLDEWYVDYFARHNDYLKNQVDNYIEMKCDLDAFANKVA